MASDLKVKIEKLLGASNWAKWKWQMLMHFQQYDLLSIIDGSRPCPVILAASETNDQMHLAQWKRDNAKASALIASALSSSVADLVLTYTDAKDIWDKLISVYEQSSVQRLSMLMTEFFQLKRDPHLDVASYVAKVEKLFNDMNVELRKRGSHDIPIELLHGQILATVGPEYQEFNNVWESLDDNKRTTNGLLEKLCTIEKRKLNVPETEHSAFVVQSRPNEKPSVSGDNVYDKGNVSRYKRSGKSKFTCFLCGEAGHIKRFCPKIRTTTSPASSPGSSDSLGQAGAFIAIKNLGQADAWVCDSGSTHHMTANKQYFTCFNSFPSPMEVAMANGSKILAYGSGTINVNMFVKGKLMAGQLLDVWYVPDVGRHLFSVRQATKRGVTGTMKLDEVSFTRGTNLVATATWYMDTYRMNMEVVIPTRPAEINLATDSDTLQVWHERFGHQDKRHVRELLETVGVRVKFAETCNFCEGCVLGKAHKRPFRDRKSRPQNCGELINADVNGPMSVPSVKGNVYLVLFKDDYSRYRRIFFIKHKNEVARCLKTFLNECKTANHTVKALRCDGGKEFDCEETRAILNDHGIAMMMSAPYSPQQNGVAEQENRTIVELARSMLSVSRLPKFLWQQACETAEYLLNRTGKSAVSGRTPVELWNGSSMTDFSHLKVFGTECYVHIPKQFRNKFDNKSVFGKMVGYINEKDGYQVYVPSKQRIVNSHDVYFKPEILCNANESNVNVDSQSVKTSERPDDFCSSNESVKSNDDSASEEELEPARPQRTTKPPAWMTSGEYILSSSCSAVADPVSYKDALCSDQRNEWLSAMKEELTDLAEAKAWTLVDKPKNVKVIGNKWVLRTKLSPDGSLQKYRARLVAKGCAQKAGIDYDETFSPVARYDTIRAVFALAAVEGLQLFQFDVKAAFLYGSIPASCAIFMNMPEGFDDGSGKVCKLNRSLYGLKQAPRCWNARFVEFLNVHKLRVSDADPCLFIRLREGKKLIVALYVDDGLIAATDESEISEFLSGLQENFKITSGSLGCFLGMQVKRRHDGIFVYQEAYIKRVLERFNLSEANAVSTPCDGNEGVQNEPLKESVPYREAVGCLIYISNATRPDLAFSVSCAARKMENPTSGDWLFVKRILRYLKGTREYGLLFRANSDVSDLKIFSDADFAGDTKTRRSTSGVAALYAGAAVSWSSRLQKTVAVSTTEAEFVAASEGAKDCLWLKNLFSEMKGHEIEKPMLRVDNASAVKLIKNPEFHNRTKHIDVRYKFIRQLYQDSIIDVCHIPGNFQLADILTKPMPRDRFQELRGKLGVVSCLGGSVEENIPV